MIHPLQVGIGVWRAALGGKLMEKQCKARRTFQHSSRCQDSGLTGTVMIHPLQVGIGVWIANVMPCCRWPRNVELTTLNYSQTLQCGGCWRTTIRLEASWASPTIC